MHIMEPPLVRLAAQHQPGGGIGSHGHHADFCGAPPLCPLPVVSVKFSRDVSPEMLMIGLFTHCAKIGPEDQPDFTWTSDRIRAEKGAKASSLLDIHTPHTPR